MLVFLIRLTIFSSVFQFLLAVKCDFDKYLNGCQDDAGSHCNQTTNECQCRIGHVLIINDSLCLPSKFIAETCFTSAQCVQLPHAKIGCYSRDLELVNITYLDEEDPLYMLKGICSCPPGFYLKSLRECVPKRLYNEPCLTSQECVTPNSYCDQETKKCRCKPTFRHSKKRDRCVSRLVGESCADNEHCLLYDGNAECRIGACQCKSGYILSSSGRCILIQTKRSSHHILMILVVVGTAIVFALLSSVHKRWATPDQLFGNQSAAAEAHLRRRIRQRMRHPRANSEPPLRDTRINLTANLHQARINLNPPRFNLNTNNINAAVNHSRASFPMPLTVPSLAVIWPISQTDSRNNQFVIEDRLPSYAEAIGECIVSNNNNNVTNNNVINNNVTNNNDIQNTDNNNNNTTTGINNNDINNNNNNDNNSGNNNDNNVNSNNNNNNSNQQTNN